MAKRVSATMTNRLSGALIFDALAAQRDHCWPHREHAGPAEVAQTRNHRDVDAALGGGDVVRAAQLLAFAYPEFSRIWR
ncbi:MAG: hypothetical protein E6Q92_10310 [Burkholderiaceae bacterium]|nr:MAG: hypothetical protein E6Q92_10310 [Burkholderiaceae bacterium]